MANTYLLINVAPTMPGLHDGEDPTRYMFPDVIDYVVDLIRSRELRDVTLVAHSWGGSVAAGVVPRVPERIRRIIFWAAFIPGGLSLFDDTLPD